MVRLSTMPPVGLLPTVSSLQQKERRESGTIPPYPLTALDGQTVPQQSESRGSGFLTLTPSLCGPSVPFGIELASIKANSA